MNRDTLAYCTIDDGFYLKLPYSISIPVIMRWWDVLYCIASLKSLQSSFSQLALLLMFLRGIITTGRARIATSHF